MDASTIPKGQSKEKNYDGRPVNMPGIYRHKDSGVKFITSSSFDEGVAQADALMTPAWKDAWEWIGEVPSKVELLATQKAQLIKDTAAEAVQKKADEAELKAIEEAATKEAEAIVAKANKVKVPKADAVTV